MNTKRIDGVRLALFLVMFGVVGALVATGCSEDNEEALSELIEFVRVAAMLVYEEQGHSEEPGG